MTQRMEGHGKLLAGVPLTQQYRLGYLAVQQHWSTRALTSAIHALKQPPLAFKKTTSTIDTTTLHVAYRVSDQLGYAVNAHLNPKQGGHVSIEFSDLAHLQSLLKKLGYQED